MVVHSEFEINQSNEFEKTVKGFDVPSYPILTQLPETLSNQLTILVFPRPNHDVLHQLDRGQVRHRYREKKQPDFRLEVGHLKSRSRGSQKLDPYEVVAVLKTTRQLSSGDATSLATKEILH